ncbi:sodium solute symporter [Aureococcus anophagefferens]|nr:sodium solute symporter [Aureococcus anophagefferens]
MSNRRQSVASQLQSERDCRRWAGWMNGRLEGAIAAAELAAIGAEEFAARLRSGVVLWMLLETFADPKELLPAGRQAPRGLREGRRRHREPSRIEAVDNLNCVFGALARLGVNHTGIGPLDVADAKTELVLGLVWSIVAPRRRRRRPVLLWARASAEESPLSAATIVPRLLRDLDDAARAALDGRGDLASRSACERRWGVAPLFDADDANVDERCLVAYLAELKKRVEAERGGAAEPAPARAGRGSSRRGPGRRSSRGREHGRRRGHRGGARAAAAALAAATDSVRTEERTAGLAALQELADGHRGKRAAIEAAAARLGAKHGEALRLMQSQAEEAIAKSRDDALAEAAEAPPPQSRPAGRAQRLQLL